MDIKTLLLCSVVVNLFLLMFLMVTVRVQKYYPGIFYWMLATATECLVCVLIYFRNTIPDFFSIVIANGLVGIVGVLRISGIRKFHGHKNSPFMLVIPVGLFFLSIYYTYVQNSVIIRVLFVSLFIIWASLWMAWEIFASMRREAPLIYFFSGLSLLLVAVIVFLRALSWFLTPTAGVVINSNFFNSIFFLLGIGIDIAWVMLFYSLQTGRLRRDIEKVNHELWQANQGKDKLFSVVAHDLRGPIGSLSAYLDYIVEEYRLEKNEEKLQILSQLSVNTKSVFRLLENLLVWARSQTGILRFSPETVELKPLVDEVMKTLTEGAKEKGVTLQNGLNDSLIVIADPVMLRTIIQNLVHNGIKFTPPGGFVKVSAEKQDAQVVIQVADNGMGVPQGKISGLFQTNTAVSTSGTAGESGSGLGLLLCADFTERHGGSIRVESKPNEGSTFIVCIPQKPGLE